MNVSLVIQKKRTVIDNLFSFSDNSLSHKSRNLTRYILSRVSSRPIRFLALFLTFCVRFLPWSLKKCYILPFFNKNKCYFLLCKVFFICSANFGVKLSLPARCFSPRLPLLLQPFTYCKAIRHVISVESWPSIHFWKSGCIHLCEHRLCLSQCSREKNQGAWRLARCQQRAQVQTYTWVGGFLVLCKNQGGREGGFCHFD